MEEIVLSEEVELPVQVRHFVPLQLILLRLLYARVLAHHMRWVGLQVGDPCACVARLLQR